MSYLTKGYATAFLFFIYLMALYWQISLLTLDFLFSFLCMLWRYLLSETPKHVYDKFRFLCGVAFSIKLQWKCPQVFSFVHVTKLLLLSTPGLNSSLSLPGGGVYTERGKMTTGQLLSSPLCTYAVNTRANWKYRKLH